MRSSRFAVAILPFFLAIAGNASQGPEVPGIMHEKLAHAQKILEAVVTDDWIALETHSRELERLTRDPRWMSLRSPEYARHSSAFLEAVQALHLAAAQRDQVKAPRAYVALTLRCVECHRYLARERVAQ